MSNEQKFSPTNEVDWSDELNEDSQKKSVSDQDSSDDTENRAPNPKKRGLGRGLDALFGDDEAEPEAVSGMTDSAGDIDTVSGVQRRTLGVDQLEPNPDQPRRKFDDVSLNELADSISRHGVLQPLLVRPKFDGSDNYEIIAGERRWRACQRAKVHSVPVIIHDLGDEQTLELALIENLQREDLNAMDEALGYKRLMDEFEKTQEQLADALGKSRSHVANMIRMTNLPDGVQAMVRDGKISAGHARTLVKADNPEAVARTIAEKGLSVREAEKLALESGSATPQKKTSQKSGKTSSKDTSAGKVQKDSDTKALEEDVANILGLKVDIQMYENNGKLTITFDNVDQLDDLLHRLTHGTPKYGMRQD